MKPVAARQYANEIASWPNRFQRAEVPSRRTINEGNYKLWDKALQNPAASADFVIAGAGGPVAQAVAAHPENLVLLGVLETPGQHPIRIYASQRERRD